MDRLEELIAAARGELEVDLLIEGTRIANVLLGEVHRANVAVHKGRIVGFDCTSARQVLDLDGRILAPGFIDGHVHIESAMVTIPEFARATVPKGTTSVVIDPHEIANVWGEEGIYYMLDSSKNVPLNVFLMLPSCVPATSMETSGELDLCRLGEVIVADPALDTLYLLTLAIANVNVLVELDVRGFGDKFEQLELRDTDRLYKGFPLEDWTGIIGMPL